MLSAASSSEADGGGGGNMVGLAYLHDPRNDPREHVQQVRRLRDALFGGRFDVFVFRIGRLDGISGDLVVVEDAELAEQYTASNYDGPRRQSEKSEAASGYRNAAAAAAKASGHSAAAESDGRAVTFDEYVSRLEELNDT